ncbi:ABC transporter permease [Goodfellowiella coeruleoviolacea]|uniref:ABC transporter permease n=1 Tax=Goodfellowiella coeruleoviolacea TaxID=334858 RepID=UPI000B1F6E17|nr:ABC transporter permease [Goodfellowiella coeruleoviolacea]
MSDTWLVFLRSINQVIRNPLSILIGMAQPALYLVLFGPMLTSLAGVAGFPAGSGWQVYVPGLLVQLALMGSGMAGFTVLPDIHTGVAERIRVTPLSRSALLLGRVGQQVAVFTAQAVVLVLAGVLFGLRAPVGGVLLGVLLAVLLSSALAAASFSIALRLPNEYLFAPVSTLLTLLLLLLSGALLPLDLAPGWLRALAAANPVSHVVDAERALFLGHLVSSRTLVGTLVTVALVALCWLWGIRTFRREHR